jgi:hypothetical protein
VRCGARARHESRQHQQLQAVVSHDVDRCGRHALGCLRALRRRSCDPIEPPSLAAHARTSAIAARIHHSVHSYAARTIVRLIVIHVDDSHRAEAIGTPLVVGGGAGVRPRVAWWSVPAQVAAFRACWRPGAWAPAPARPSYFTCTGWRAAVYSQSGLENVGRATSRWDTTYPKRSFGSRFAGFR